MLLVTLLAVSQIALLAGYPARTYNTTSGRPATTTPFPYEECPETLLSSLHFGPLVNFKYDPEPTFTNKTSIAWDSCRGVRPSVELAVCEMTSISDVSFSTENVKHTEVTVDGTYIHGGVDPVGNVRIRTGFDFMSQVRFGNVIKIVLTPKHQRMPVKISNLEVQTCKTVLYDCFEECPLYIPDPDTGCKLPRCSPDSQCSKVSCSDGQECRLIIGEDVSTFPDLMGLEAQFWGCVDKNRKDYGCTCDGDYGIDSNQCPTCSCNQNQFTTTTESFVP